ncbi:MAG: serine/threonine-protein phosphatase [Lachnospiraceae bacterium]|nr:serine/threonine-protein phosphatase [Lachnospiraceae bacterium]
MCERVTKPYPVSLGVSSLIGTRPDQQDSVYGEILEHSLVAILCDGMGGLQEGALASQTAIQTFAEDYEKRDRTMKVPIFLRQEAIEMDMVVHDLVDDSQTPVKAGSTVAAVVLQKNELYWLSVGDSRIYIIRGEEMMAVNRDHNYRLRLDEALETGNITKELYEQEEKKGEALISYLGMGNLTLMDVNREPFLLQPEDVVLVCSDGLYKTLSNEQIVRIVKEYLPDTQKTADMLTETAVLASLENQDNTSAVVIQYLGE